MAVRKKARGPVPLFISILCTAGLVPFIGLYSLIVFPFLLYLTSSRQIQSIEEKTGDNSAAVEAQCKRARRLGETGMTMSKTIGSGGAMFDLPMTVEYDITDDDD